VIYLAILGSGQSHGACSLLHAAGTGYGSSIALDLPVGVRLLDKPSKRDLDDPDGLLDSVIKIWTENGYDLPNGLGPEQIFWAVASKIPPKQGLKSSAAVSIAALRSLCDATGTQMEIHRLVELCALSQFDAGVSLTGSIDDAWACATKGWKLIDVNAESIKEGVIMEGKGPESDDWFVLIVSREKRTQSPTLEDFQPFFNDFQQALSAIQEGDLLNAITWNGRAMSGVLNDYDGRRISNDAFVNGARAAGISGSGPAVVILSPSITPQTINRMKKILTSRADKTTIIETKFLNSEGEDVDSD
jgi:shikimate kinase